MTNEGWVLIGILVVLWLLAEVRRGGFPARRRYLPSEPTKERLAQGHQEMLERKLELARLARLTRESEVGLQGLMGVDGQAPLTPEEGEENEVI